jgi:hypothetical protein
LFLDPLLSIHVSKNFMGTTNDEQQAIVIESDDQTSVQVPNNTFKPTIPYDYAHSRDHFLLTLPQSKATCVTNFLAIADILAEGADG